MQMYTIDLTPELQLLTSACLLVIITSKSKRHLTLNMSITTSSSQNPLYLSLSYLR